MTTLNLVEHNREAWDKIAQSGCPWSVPVSDEDVARASNGEWSLTVAGPELVPRDWFGDIDGKRILCLASGGGQQVPILAATGAQVTSYDLSWEQLRRDQYVCSRNGLNIRIEQGDMSDLSRFADASFDLIFNPVSNPYVSDVHAVWRGCSRVLQQGGRLIAGSINPLNYLFEENDGDTETGLTVTYALPFVEIETLSEQEVQEAFARKMIFTWSHSLEDILDG